MRYRNEEKILSEAIKNSIENKSYTESLVVIPDTRLDQVIYPVTSIRILTYLRTPVIQVNSSMSRIDTILTQMGYRHICNIKSDDYGFSNSIVSHYQIIE